jgi:hypothetical protein
LQLSSSVRPVRPGLSEAKSRLSVLAMTPTVTMP